MSYVCPFGSNGHDTGTDHVSETRFTLRLHMMTVHGCDLVRSPSSGRDRVFSFSAKCIQKKLDHYMSELKSDQLHKGFGTFLKSIVPGVTGTETAVLSQPVTSKIATVSSPIEFASVLTGSVASTARISWTSSSPLTAGLNIAMAMAATMKFACPKCDFGAIKLNTMQHHCISDHGVEWQGHGLPLGENSNVELPPKADVESVNETVCRSMTQTSDASCTSHSEEFVNGSIVKCQAVSVSQSTAVPSQHARCKMFRCPVEGCGFVAQAHEMRSHCLLIHQAKCLPWPRGLPWREISQEDLPKQMDVESVDMKGTGDTAVTQTTADTSCISRSEEFVNTSIVSQSSSVQQHVSAATSTMYVCPKCDFSANMPKEIQRHAWCVHRIEWQGNDLPLQEISQEALPTQTDVEIVDMTETVSSVQTSATTSCTAGSENVVTRSIISCQPSSVQLPLLITWWKSKSTTTTVRPVMSTDVSQGDAGKTPTNTTDSGMVLYVCPFGSTGHDTGMAYIAVNRLALLLHIMMAHGCDVVKDHVVVLSVDTLRKKLEFYTSMLMSSQKYRIYHAFLMSGDVAGLHAAMSLQPVKSRLATVSPAVKSTRALSGSVTSGSPVARFSGNAVKGAMSHSSTVTRTSAETSCTPEEFVNRVMKSCQLTSDQHPPAGMSKMKFLCPDCDFVSKMLRFIRRHCISAHEAEWQGNGLPLQKISRKDLSRQTDVVPKQSDNDVVKDQHRSHSASRQRSQNRSPSPSPPGDGAVYKHPLGTGEMLTPKEFERLQQNLRMESGFAHVPFTPPPLQIPPQVPIHHPPPPVMYPPPVTPAGGSFIVSHQAMTMPPPPHEPFPGPPILMPPPQEVFHRLAPPPQVPVAQPLPPPPHEAIHRLAPPPQLPVAQPLPPPGIVLQVPAGGPPLVIPSGNPPPGMHLPPPPVHFPPQ